MKMFNWFKKAKDEEEKVNFKKIDDTFDDLEELLRNSSNKELYEDLDELARDIKDKFFSIQNTYKIEENGSQVVDEQYLYENYTVAVEGRWGTGKTTFIRCLLSRLHDYTPRFNHADAKWYEKFDKNESEGHVVWLNPWAFSSKKDLKHYLVSSILSNYKDINHKNEYIKQFSPNNSSGLLLTLLNTNKNNLIGFFVFLFISSMLINWQMLTKNISSISIYIGYLFSFLIVTVSVLFVKSLLDYSYEKVTKKTNASYLKKKLDDRLKRENKRFICVIDDIDRLSKEEVLDLFKTIKEIIDFPNVLFILAYDKEILNEYFSSDSKCSQKGEYLAKIVQKTASVKTFVDLYIMDELEELYTYNPSHEGKLNVWSSVDKTPKPDWVKKDRVNGFLRSKMIEDKESFKTLFDNNLFTIRDVKEHLKEIKEDLINNNLRLDLDIPLYVFVRLLKEKSKEAYSSLKYHNYSKSGLLSSLNEYTYDGKRIVSYINKVISDCSLGGGDYEQFRSCYLGEFKNHYGVLDVLNTHKTINLPYTDEQSDYGRVSGRGFENYFKYSRENKKHHEYLKYVFSNDELVNIDLYLRSLNDDHSIGDITRSSSCYHISNDLVSSKICDLYEVFYLYDKKSVSVSNLNGVVIDLNNLSNGKDLAEIKKYDVPAKLEEVIMYFISKLDSFRPNSDLLEVINVIINIYNGNNSKVLSVDQLYMFLDAIKQRYKFLSNNKDFVSLLWFVYHENKENSGFFVDRMKGVIRILCYKGNEEGIILNSPVDCNDLASLFEHVEESEGINDSFKLSLSKFNDLNVTEKNVLRL